MSDLRVDEASVEDAEAVCNVIHEAFAARPRLDPSSTALAETVASVADTLTAYGGLLCRLDGQPAGAVLFDATGPAFGLRRVSVVPRFQYRGVASALVGVAEEVAAVRGFDDVQLRARSELPATVTFWRRRGYAELARTGTTITMGKALPVETVAATPGDARAVGRRIAALTRGGDVVLLVGELGAGKTTLTQGIGEGLRVRGPVTSPTFVICRLHPSTSGGPSLVHVDAYRLGDAAELDDIDIDVLVGNAVTVVEWGEGIAEALSDDRLRVRVARPHGAESTDETDERVITVTPVGARWVGARVRSTVAAET